MALHKFFRKNLAAFQLRRSSPRTQDRQPSPREFIRNAVNQTAIPAPRSSNRRRAVQPNLPPQSRSLRPAACIPRRARCPRFQARTKSYPRSRTLPQLPRHRVFASAAANNQNFHVVRRNKNDTAPPPAMSTFSRVPIARSTCYAARIVFSFSAMHWDFALILLFLGIALPLLGRRRVRQLMQSPSTTKLDRLSLYASTLAFQWLAAGVILWRAAAHGMRAAQLGFSIGNPSLTITVTNRSSRARTHKSVGQSSPHRRAPRRGSRIAPTARAQIISAG